MRLDATINKDANNNKGLKAMDFPEATLESQWFMQYLTGEERIGNHLAKSLTTYVIRVTTLMFNAQVADDILDVVMEKVFINAGQTLLQQLQSKEIDNIRPFVKKVCRTTAIDHLRSANYKAFHTKNIVDANEWDDVSGNAVLDLPELTTSGPLQHFSEVDGPFKIVGAVLQAMKPINRQVVTMRLMGYKAREICEILGITEEQEKHAKKIGLKQVIEILIDSGYTLDEFVESPLNKPSLRLVSKELQKREKMDNEK